MSKIDDLNIQPKFDNALQVQRTANIPDNEKYTAKEWNSLISKTNEVVGRANLNTWSIVTNYSELPTDPVNGQKVYVTGTGLNGHVSVQMMPNGKTSRGFYVYDAFSDIWVQKTSESELSAITFSIDTNWSGLPTEPNQGDIFELTTNDTPIPANVIGVVDPNETAGKYQFNGTVWVAKSDTVLYQEVLAMLDDKLDLDMNNLAGDLTEQEQDTIKSKLGIDEGGKLDTDMNNLDDDILEADKKIIREKLGAAYEGDNNTNSGELSGSLAGFNNDNSGDNSGSVGGGYNQNTGGYSGSVGGAESQNTGSFSGSVGGFGLENKTFAETSRGRFNLSESNHANSVTVWHEDDLIESVGGGTGNANRLNLFARYKSGAFYWIKKTLSTITNAVKGFHAADTDGRLNYYDGTAWKKYLLEGEGSGGGLNFIKIEDQFDDGGDLDFNLILDEGIYVAADNDFRLIVNAPNWLAIDTTTMYGLKLVVYKQNGMTVQEMTYWHPQEDVATTSIRIYDGSTWTNWRSGDQWVIGHITPQINNKNYLKETNNNDNLSFWTGTQAEYDAITTKNPTTLYIIN